MPQTNGSLTSGHSSSANSSSSEASEAKQSLSKKENIICTEVFDENSSPTKDGEIGRPLDNNEFSYSITNKITIAQIY